MADWLSVLLKHSMPQKAMSLRRTEHDAKHNGQEKLE